MKRPLLTLSTLASAVSFCCAAPAFAATACADLAKLALPDTKGQGPGVDARERS